MITAEALKHLLMVLKEANLPNAPKEINDYALAAYHMSLGDYSEKEIATAVRKILKNQAGSGFYPSARELHEVISGISETKQLTPPIGEFKSICRGLSWSGFCNYDHSDKALAQCIRDLGEGFAKSEISQESYWIDKFTKYYASLSVRDSKTLAHQLEQSRKLELTDLNSIAKGILEHVKK